MQPISFEQAIKEMGISPEGLWVEGVDAGSSNVVINLNYRGVTWAVAVRAPVDGGGQAFVGQKTRTAEITQYLSNIFASGVDLGSNRRFVFDGMSFLVDGDSTKEFLNNQYHAQPLVVEDRIRGIEPRTLPRQSITGYLLKYEGPFFISKGAPAQETLEHSSQYAEIMLRGLAALHAHTGAQQALKGGSQELKAIELQLVQDSQKWSPEAESKAGRRIAQYSAMPGQDNQAAKCEVFLQQDQGRMRAQDLTRQHFGSLVTNQLYRSFIHGDAHGRNFIVVEYAHHQPNSAFLDRRHLNELFADYPELQHITIEDAGDGARLIYRDYQTEDDNKHECIVVTRGNRQDVHLIDPDTGRGIRDKEKECYLYDLVTLCLSIRNWHGIHGNPEPSFSQMLDIYSDQFYRQQKPD